MAFFDGAVWTTHFGLLADRPGNRAYRRRFELAGDLSNMDVGFDSLWVGANDGTVAYRVHPDGRVDTLQVDAQGPSSFAVGRDAVWVTARPGNVVRRIDPATNALGPPIAVGNNPTMGAEAADGSIVVPITGDGTLARIDPARNAVVETIRVGSRPVKVVRVGGALWVTHLGGTRLAREPRALGGRLAVGEEAVDLVVQRAFVVDELLGELARPLEQVTVGAQARETELREAGLARAEQLPLPQLEIDLGELEAVGRPDQRLEPRLRGVGQLLLRARDQQAVRLLRPAPDPPSELMELREPEAVCLLDDHDRRVRDVHADLDHRRRDEDVQLLRLETRHQVAPLVRP